MEKLVACVHKKPDALCRLICFSWAGGGTSQLAQWGKLFSDSIEAEIRILWILTKGIYQSYQLEGQHVRLKEGWKPNLLQDYITVAATASKSTVSTVRKINSKMFCIRLPGRETRLEEPFAKDMTSLINEVTSVLLKELKEKPFAFFGHSLGTYISFAIALHLKEKYGLEPVHLFVSGAHAPNSAECFAIRTMPISDGKDEILAYIKAIGRTPELLLHEDIVKQMALTLREDVRLFQTFSFEKAEMNIPFSCDVTCFCGSDDKVYDIQGWQKLTSGDISFYELPGGHFYLLETSNEHFLIKHITRCIENAGL